MILICTSQGALQRWNVQTESGSSYEVIFNKESMVGTLRTEHIFMFTLISTTSGQIVSKVSTVTTDNTIFQCAGHSPPATVTIRIIG